MSEKLKRAVYCFIDTETTGLTEKHGLVELAAIFVDDRLRIVDKTHLFSQPVKGDLCSKEAEQVTGYTMDKVAAFPTSKESFNLFKSALDKHVNKFDKRHKLVFSGYNSAFDTQMVRAWFSKHGDSFYGSYFWSTSMDVMSLAMYKLWPKRADMENFRLGTVCKTVGVEFDSDMAHGAMYDIEKTLELYAALMF